jgi:2'-5' RNA ligase
MAATALIVPFEQADPLLLRWRRAHTTDGAEGMPAHVTLIYPFVDDVQLVAGQVSELRGVLAAFTPFDVRFTSFGRFDRPPSVLYLKPEPAKPFMDMVDAIVDRFPTKPPYGGEFDTVVPHLTVAQTSDAEVLDNAEADVATHLPLAARTTHVHVMPHYGTDGWRMRNRIDL